MPARADQACLLSWRGGGRSCHTRRVSAAGLARTSGEIITQIQLGGSRTDSLVRILHAQPTSPVSAGDVRFEEIGATFPRVSETLRNL